MKHAAPTQPVTSVFCALFLAVMLVLTGCNAGTLSGPDLAPSDDITVVTNDKKQRYERNEGEYEKKQRYERNEGEYEKKQRYERNEGEYDD